MRRQVEITFYLMVAFLVSICGMSYELILVRVLGSLSNDSVTSQSITIGTFLLSLGIGAFLFGKSKARDDQQSVLRLLIAVEICLSVFALFAIPSIQIASLYVKGAKLVVYSQLVTLIIGTLSGIELPAFIELLKPHLRKSFAWVLAANYAGAFAASLLIALRLVPSLGVITASWLIALLSAAVASLLFFRRFNFSLSWHWIGIPAAVMLPGFFTVNLRIPLEQFYLKSFYYAAPSTFSDVRSTLRLHAQIPRVLRISSPYQEIDIVRSDSNVFGVSGQSVSSEPDAFFLYLDQKFQLSSITEQIYHETMVHGGLNLAPREAKKVLIVGGGDGLIARELLKYREVETITLVELDEEVISLANMHPALSELTQGSLRDSRVKVEIADGFEWLKRNREKFDTIFIDLPHPVSVDLSRLYSVEFYRFVKRALEPGGSMIFDFPADGILKNGSRSEQNVFASILASLVEAGLPHYAAFGTWESFLIVSSEKHDFKFDYDRLDQKISDKSAFNMELLEVKLEPARANSIFRPSYLRERNAGG